MTGLIEATVEAVRERTKIARLYRKNAQLRHGIPDDDDVPPVTVEHKHAHQHGGLDKGAKAVEKLAEAVEAARPVTPASGDLAPKAKSLWAKWGRTATIAAAFGGPLGAGSALLINYLTATPEATVPADGSLLQYLEDKGQHLQEPFSP